ncbi:MAG: C-GCAxxG-C-C family protein [Spirochaetes bacterium]|nr:C-GCAxxG-C-C family protein [Spirochaetota bacterium]
MENTLSQKAIESAAEFHSKGYNCAESIFLTFRTYISPEISEDMVRMVTPFGGGLGRAGCMCGALSGATMILGAAKGRINFESSREPSYELSYDFHEQFRTKFRTTCCRSLMKHKFGSKEQRESCHKIITESAGLLMDFLIDKDLVNSENKR